MKKIASILMMFVFAGVVFAADDYWVKPMADIHKNFKGKKGTVALYGDSITYVERFWTPIKDGVVNCKDIDVQKLVKYIEPECWKWKGEKNGNVIGWSVRNGLQVIDKVLPKHNPEVAIVMFGTNDIERGTVKDRKFIEEMSTVIQKCLDNGTVVILSTIPPRRNWQEKVKEFNEAIKTVAKNLNIPLIDFYEEVMKRRPNDWDGTLISDKDGCHPTWDNQKGNDFSEESLKSNGYILRNYITLKKYDEVYEKILKK